MPVGDGRRTGVRGGDLTTESGPPVAGNIESEVASGRGGRILNGTGGLRPAQSGARGIAERQLESRGRGRRRLAQHRHIDRLLRLAWGKGQRSTGSLIVHAGDRRAV